MFTLNTLQSPEFFNGIAMMKEFLTRQIINWSRKNINCIHFRSKMYELTDRPIASLLLIHCYKQKCKKMVAQ